MPGPVMLSETIQYTLLPPATLKKEFTSYQLVKGQYQHKKYNFNFVTKVDKNTLTLIALTNIGTTLFSIKYDGKQINFSSTIDNKQIKPEYMLADFQLTYWPIELLQKNISASCQITENAKMRMFSENNQKIIAITYEQGQSISSNILFENFKRGFSYRIEQSKES